MSHPKPIPRVPPHDVDAEQSVLGCILRSPEAFAPYWGQLTESDFWRRDHRLIYRAMAAPCKVDVTDSHGSGSTQRVEPIDQATVAIWLESHDLLRETEGREYLDHLLATTPGTRQLASYVERVENASAKRRLISLGTDLIERGMVLDGTPVTQLLDQAQGDIFSLRQHSTRHSTGPRLIKESVRAAYQAMAERFRSGQTISGLPTGFCAVDELLGGLQPTDLIILAARPAMGKTAFALNIATYAAIVEKKRVAIFSLEMSTIQLAFRVMATYAGVSQGAIQSGRLTGDEMQRIQGTTERLSETPLFIIDTPALSPTEVRSRARALSSQGKVDLVVIDYLQLMQVPERKGNRTDEIAQISRSLKGLAKELEAPVIALSQLNRSLESRPDKRPVMSDLRDSGSIEQDADQVIFLYRDEYYNPKSKDVGLAEVIVGKNRSGPTGTAKLAFQGEYVRFLDIPPLD